MLDRDDLLEALRRGHRSAADRRLGVEFEQFVLRGEDAQAVPYLGAGGVAELLERAEELTGWERIEEDGHLLGLKAADGRALTLEPGAQLEFGSSPCRTLAEVAAEVEDYCRLLARLSQESGVGFLAVGSHPSSAPEDIVRLPKKRYDVLEPWLREAGDLGLWMMKTTCGVQINFDHEDGEDAMRKLRTVYATAPIFNALFANSALRAGEASGYASWRGHVWSRTDPGRCGIFEQLTRPDSTLDDYVDWMLDVPMLFVLRDGEYVDLRGHSFRDWIRDGHATAADWDLHLSTPFPEVRFRPQIELRSADSLPPRLLLACAALVQGLFYDADALERTWQPDRRLEPRAAHRQLACRPPRRPRRHLPRRPPAARLCARDGRLCGPRRGGSWLPRTASRNCSSTAAPLGERTAAAPRRPDLGPAP